MRNKIVKWNNEFPLDRWWRLKYSIPYNSQEHREVSQLDIFFEWYEDFIFEQLRERNKLAKEKSKLLDEGILLSQRTEESSVDFEDLDLSQFNFE
jgi:hypothetical protein